MWTGPPLRDGGRFRPCTWSSGGDLYIKETNAGDTSIFEHENSPRAAVFSIRSWAYIIYMCFIYSVFSFRSYIHPPYVLKKLSQRS